MKLFRGRKLRLYLSIAFMLVVLAGLTKLASADAWSWSGGIPTTVSSIASDPTAWNQLCGSRYRDGSVYEVPVVGLDNGAQANSECMIADGGNYKLLSYNGQRNLAIQFIGDTKAFSIKGIGCATSCVYLPNEGSLVMVSPAIFNGTGPVYVYKNFISHLQLQRQLSLSQRYYQFDGAQPETQISSTGSNGFGYVKTIGMSQNGRWLVADFVGQGLARIDLSSMQILKFSDYRTNYSDGTSAPQIQFDITDDGSHIAVLGHKTLNTIFDIVPGCGTSVSAPPTYDDLYRNQQTPCPSMNLNQPLDNPSNNTYMPNMGYTDIPRFSDDGGEISFYAQTYDFSGQAKSVSLRANGYTGPAPLKYLALGDSISSGEGDIGHKPQTNTKYYSSNSDTEENAPAGQPREKCHQSTRSYPYLLASLMQLNQTDWNSVACSGATVSDVTVNNSGGTFFGQAKGSRFLWSTDGNIPRLFGYPNNIANLQSSALSDFVPGRVEQIKFIHEYKPKVITVTMGANDISFASKLGECVSLRRLLPYTCDWATTKKSELAKTIQNQYDNLARLYSSLIKATNGGSKIYVVGYPRLISDEDPGSCGLSAGSLDLVERKMIVRATDYLNTVIEHAANLVGVKYLDISNALNGGRLCDDGQAFVNGIEGLGDTEVQESFHPNSYGHIGIAEKIEKDLGGQSLLNFNSCQFGVAICPKTDGSEVRPDIPDYFSGQSTTNSKSTKITSTTVTKGNSENLKLDKYQTESNGVLKGSIHSNPIDLGEFRANEDGSLSAIVTIPNTTPVGYHEIVLSGQSYSGEPVDYTQSIFVIGSNPNDIDEDGVLDSQQACGPFLPQSGVDNNLNGIDDACDPNQSQQKPPAPANLNATSPTNTGPVLTWSVVNNVKTYNVYRDGSLLVSTNSATYTDTTATDGNHSYFVTTFSNVESDRSNVYTVLIDRINPIVKNARVTGFGIISLLGLTPIVLPINAPVTVSADALDNGSGVLSGEFYIDTDPGVGQGTQMSYSNGRLITQTSTNKLKLGYHYLYARAKDKAGNWSNQVQKTLVYI